MRSHKNLKQQDIKNYILFLQRLQKISKCLYVKLKHFSTKKHVNGYTLRFFLNKKIFSKANILKSLQCLTFFLQMLQKV